MMQASPTPTISFVDLGPIDLKVIIGFSALVIGLITLIYFQWWRNRKRMSYEITSDVQLISAQEELEGKVEIHYEGRPIKDVHLLVIKLINDGYQSIDARSALIGP